jgi:chromosome segregation ATPase
MDRFIIGLFFVTILLINTYIYFSYKKDILIKQKQVSEEKVKTYLLYLSSIIENKNKEIDELSILYDVNPDDKELKNAIDMKNQEKSALQEELSKVVEHNSENTTALMIEREIILKENNELKSKINALANLTDDDAENSKVKEMKEKYDRLSQKYNKILEDYKEAKGKLEELDEEFNNVYNN